MTVDMTAAPETYPNSFIKDMQKHNVLFQSDTWRRCWKEHQETVGSEEEGNDGRPPWAQARLHCAAKAAAPAPKANAASAKAKAKAKAAADKAKAVDIRDWIGNGVGDDGVDFTAVTCATCGTIHEIPTAKAIVLARAALPYTCSYSLADGCLSRLRRRKACFCGLKSGEDLLGLCADLCFFWFSKI